VSNHGLFRIIPDPGSQKRITLSLESISTIPFQARARDVKIPEWRQHRSNRRMACIVSIFGIFRGSGDHQTKNPGAHCRCTSDIFSNIPDCQLQRPAMLVARKINPVSLVGYTNDWHNRRSGRNLILHIPPPIACVHLSVYSAAFRLCKPHRFEREVCLK